LSFFHFDLAQGVMLLIPLLLSLTVHEWAHAWSAYRLGDDTAARLGRLTLNPIAHIDPIGTLILPLLGIPFGWAKPVPVVASRFRRGVNMTTGMIITAAAGPLANVGLAILSAIGIGLVARFAPQSLAGGGGLSVLGLLSSLLMVNVTLALFNLIPIPPLDGSRIVDGLIPYSWRPQWESIMRLSPILFIAVFFFGGRIIAAPAAHVLGWLGDLINAIRT
jgi:Zn-dependent protease